MSISPDLLTRAQLDWATIRHKALASGSIPIVPCTKSRSLPTKLDAVGSLHKVASFATCRRLILIIYCTRRLWRRYGLSGLPFWNPKSKSLQSIVVFTSRLTYVLQVPGSCLNVWSLHGERRWRAIYQANTTFVKRYLQMCYQNASATPTAAWSASGPISQCLHGPLEIFSFEISANKIQCSPKEKSYVNPKSSNATNSSKR